jgi:lipopolysaccharide transport system permease protein
MCHEKTEVTMPRNSDYEVIIKARRSWFYIDWWSLLHYRDLLLLLVRRDFVARYKQTLLGPAWFVIQPILTSVVFTIVFKRVANISTDGLPPYLFYFCGLVIWDYFSRSINSTATAFVTHAHLFEKVYFPRLIVPLSSVISNLFSFAIQLCIFLGFYFYFMFFTPAKTSINANLFLLALPLLVLQTLCFALGVGLWISALTAKYRDFTFVMTFLTQLWMYATPVIYPVSTIPEQWRFIMVLNPMAAVVALFRHAFFGTAALGPRYLLASALCTVLVLISGVLVFNRVERTVVDTV